MRSGTAPPTATPTATPTASTTGGIRYWFRVGLLLLVRPALWGVALRQMMRLARRGWWRRPPYLPLPDRDVLRFRFETAYGRGGEPDPRDFVQYLRWCRSRA